jgi:hypothetical protein
MFLLTFRSINYFIGRFSKTFYCFRRYDCFSGTEIVILQSYKNKKKYYKSNKLNLLLLSNKYLFLYWKMTFNFKVLFSLKETHYGINITFVGKYHIKGLLYPKGFKQKMFDCSVSVRPSSLLCFVFYLQ